MSNYGTTNSNPYDTDADPYDYDYQPFERTPITNVSGTMNTGGLPPIPNTVPQQQQQQQQYLPQQPQRYSSPVLTHSSMSSSSPQDESLRLKAMELARREAELERREQDLTTREGDYVIQPKKNWPICKPFLYHNIAGEMPAGIRRTAAYMGYIGWMIFSVVLVLNAAGAWITVFSKAGEKAGIERVMERVKFLLFASLFVVVGIPCHFILSYWPLYQAMRTVNIGRFTLFFVGYAIPIVFCAFCVSGWSDYGPCGIIVAILYFPTGKQGNVLAFVYNLVMTVLWAALCVYFVVIYIMAIRVFRRENHTLAKARAYAQNSIMSGVASAAVSNVFSTNGGNGEQ